MGGSRRGGHASGEGHTQGTVCKGATHQGRAACKGTAREGATRQGRAARKGTTREGATHQGRAACKGTAREGRGHGTRAVQPGNQMAEARRVCEQGEVQPRRRVLCASGAGGVKMRQRDPVCSQVQEKREGVQAGAGYNRAGGRRVNERRRAPFPHPRAQ